MRDPHDIRHGDTWTVRNGRAVIVAMGDWPAPTIERRAAK